METFQIRTDLALEARESVNEEESKLRGVSVDEHYEEETDIRITKVTIDTKNAEKTLGKPMGVYVTMEAPAMVEPDDDYHREISEALAEELLKMLPGEAEELSVLIVGLGNREVTADALGPQVVDNLLITRHVVRAYGKAAYNCTRMNLVSSIEPGVMAKTGMETAEIIGGVVKETEPDVLIAVDALAARSIKRLNRTIQITNTGIQPGSGVGNHRSGLTEETLGIPGFAIGIPMVVGAAAIVYDTVGAMTEVLREQIEGGIRKTEDPEHLQAEEAYELVRELLKPDLGPMYVTPHDVDERVDFLSFTISEALHGALFEER